MGRLIPHDPEDDTEDVPVPVEVPADLEETLRDKVAGTATAWDEALWELAREALEDAEAE
jgi:hypothetical protein